MADDYSFRAAEFADLPLLREFEQGVIAAERPYSLNLKPGPIQYYDLELMLQADDTQLLVCELAGEAIGSGYARLQKSAAQYNHDLHVYLGFIYVVPAHRGKGVSGLIMEALLTWARDAGAREVRLDVYVDNEAAVRAYEKFGFAKILVNMRKTL